MTSDDVHDAADDLRRLSEDLVQLARLALTGRPQDVETYLRRLARRHSGSELLSEKLTDLLRSRPSRQSPMRDAQAGLVEATPVDLESRLDLVRYEIVPLLPAEPIWQLEVAGPLNQLVAERSSVEALASAGLNPTRTALFTGPPGVGKTLAARWLARELGVPLLILDLAAVMSSYLGRTGSNLRKVLDYAKGQSCVLLLDELDAVAKRRDDVSEIGELKRLVTVLLQEVDDWPPSGLLLAATNHPELLDPAVWRRFEMVLQFPMPDRYGLETAARQFLGSSENHEELISVLAVAYKGSSFNDVERDILAARRYAALDSKPVATLLMERLATRSQNLAFAQRRDAAAELIAAGRISQRRASELFGVSRDVLRKAGK